MSKRDYEQFIASTLPLPQQWEGQTIWRPDLKCHQYSNGSRWVSAVTATDSGALVGLARSALLPVLRSEALVKPWTAAPSFGKSTPLSTSDITTCVKMEMEAHFCAVKLMSQNVGNQALSNLRSLVGVTETNATDTSGNLAHVVKGGVTYTGMAGATDQNGHRLTYWAGVTPYSELASSSAPVITASDWVPLQSIPRADGGSRPLLIWKSWRQGSASGNWAFSALANGTRTPSAANRGRTIVPSRTFADGVTTPAQTYSLDNTAMHVFPVVRFIRPVLSVWCCGDSNTACDGLAADKVSSWGWRACADLSTPDLPIVFANFGVSGAIASDFLANVEGYLTAGAPPPSVLCLNANSINELGTTPDVRRVENIRNIALRGIEVCRKWGISYLMLMPTLPSENIATAQLDDLRKTGNLDVSIIAGNFGATWLGGFGGVGDGASPEKFIPAYKFDTLHPNELAIEEVLTVVFRDALRRIIGV